MSGRRAAAWRCHSCGRDRPREAFTAPSARVCKDCVYENRKRRCARCRERRPTRDFWFPEEIAASLDVKVPALKPHQVAKRRGLARRRSAVCIGCWREAERVRVETRLRQRATWVEDGVTVRRCGRCRVVKPLDAEHYYTQGKGGFRHRCADCDREQRREQHAAIMRNPARRSHLRRVRRENQRMNRRLKAMRAGRPMPALARAPKRADERRPRVLALPLAFAVERHVERRQATPGYQDREVAEAQERIVEALGITARTLRAWLAGERLLAQQDEADRILIELGLNWWDVWHCDRHGEPEPGCADCEGAEMARAAFEGEPSRRAA